MSGFLIGVLEQGFIFAIVALGVYITYKILDFPDLSVDGTFPLGAALTALCLSKGINPFMACIFSIIAGMIAGIMTGILHVKLKITNLLSGILMMIGLYSINLRVMGKANIAFFGFDTIFSTTSMVAPIIIIAVVAIGVKILLDVFLKTKLGFALNAVGDNEQLVTSLGIDKDVIKVVGLSISNGIVALGGFVMAQHQGYADVGMGTGTVVVGLAAVILGRSILGKIKFIKATAMAVIGAILYKLAISGALRFGLNPQDLKLVTSLIVILVLGANNFNFGKSFSKIGRKGDEPIAATTKSIQGVQ